MISENTPKNRWKKLGILLAKGIVSYVPAHIVLLIFKNILSVSYRPVPFFFYYFLIDHVIYFSIMIACYFLFQGTGSLKQIKTAFWDYCAFATGFYTLASIHNLILYAGELDIYGLFFIPIIRFAVIILSAIFLIRFFLSYGFLKSVFTIGLIFVLVLSGVITSLYKANYYIYSFIAVCMLFFSSFFLMFYLKE